MLWYTVYIMFGVLKNYIFWHYTTAFVDQVYILKNYLWFLKHFFSVSEVLGSLFAPWKRMGDEKGSLVKSPGDFFSVLVVNTIMRVVGFFARAGLLFGAFFCFVALLVFALFFVVFWTLLPLILGYFFVTSILLFLP